MIEKRGRHKKDCKCETCKRNKKNGFAVTEINSAIPLSREEFAKLKSEIYGKEKSSEENEKLSIESNNGNLAEELENELASILSDVKEDEKVTPQQPLNELPLEKKNTPLEKSDTPIEEMTMEETFNIMDGGLLLVLVDFVIPRVFLFLGKQMSKKLKNIDVTQIKLDEEEIEELTPIADKIVEKYLKNKNPIIALLIFMSALYTVKIGAVTEK